MATYNKKTVEQITALIEEGNHSISTICKIAGIGRKTFYDWKNTHPDFVVAIEDAEQRRSEELYELASKALRKKIEGYYQTTSRTIYIPSEDDPETLEIKQHIVTQKYCEPDTKILLEILNIRTSKKKSGRGRSKGINPALVVKKAESEIRDNVAEIPPFSIKAKEVVEHDKIIPEAYIEEKMDRKEEETKSIETPLTNNKLVENKDADKIEEKKNTLHAKYEPVPQPLPPGYTRRA